MVTAAPETAPKYWPRLPVIVNNSILPLPAIHNVVKRTRIFNA